jgi:diaminohydroxyphosphoribosylaminopyrimidine deaminase/5-amino-6-(5-phosphoribosylamino)uracil reductase
VLTTSAADAEACRAWAEAGVEVEELPPAVGGGGVDLGVVLDVLGRRDIVQVMVEGGAHVHGALLRAGLADRLVVYTGGVVLGAGGIPLFAGPGPGTLTEASRWRLAGVRQLGGDARLDWERVQPGN